jgi:hypothetical protein
MVFFLNILFIGYSVAGKDFKRTQSSHERMERNYRVVKRNNVLAKKLVSRDYGYMCNEFIFVSI